ncbi:MAG: hypothetical protein ACTSRK_09190 [Promethearchaeota archaeon]
MDFEPLTQLLVGIEEILQEMLYSGLQYIHSNLVQKINILFHQASKLNHYRIATSLRYIKIELERFQNKPESFSMERLMLFISQSWLLLQKTRSLILDNDIDGINKIMINQTKLDQIPEIEAQMVGLRQHAIKDSIMGFTFYFILFGKKYQKEIYVLDFIMKFIPSSNLDHLLFRANSQSSILWYKNLYFKIKFKKLQIDNQSRRLRVDDTTQISILPKQNILKGGIVQKGLEKIKKQYLKNKGKKMSGGKEIFPESDQLFLDKYDSMQSKISFREEKDNTLLKKIKKLYYEEKIENLSKKIQDYEIKPFDTPETFTQYILLKDVKVRLSSIKVEDTSQSKPQKYFEIESDLGIPFIIKIESKPINKELEKTLEEFQTTGTKLDYFFGFYFVSDNNLNFFPLSFFQNNELHFLALNKTTNYKIKNNVIDLC